MKKTAAAMVSPLTLPIFFFLGKMLFFDASDPNYFRHTAFETLAAILPFSYIFSFLIGIPAIFFLSKIGKLTAPWLISVGFIGGLLSVFLVLAITANLSALRESIFLFASAGFAGFLAVVFCLLSYLPASHSKDEIFRC